MKNYQYIIIAFACWIFAGCKEDTLETWEDNGRVWFTSADPFIASFKKLPASVTEMIAEVPISLAGKLENKDREILVVIEKDKRNAATRYELQMPVVLAAGTTSAVLKVKVYKTANLAVEADTLNFLIRSSATLEPGIEDQLKCTFVMINRYTQPKWWNDYYCGNYTEAKHEVLLQVFSSDDDIRGDTADDNIWFGWSSADALYNLYLLNKFCEEKGYSFRFENGK